MKPTRPKQSLAIECNDSFGREKFHATIEKQ